MTDIRLRILLVPLLLAGLLLAAAPAIRVEAAGPRTIPTTAAEVARAVQGQHTFGLPLSASHVAVHWPGQHDARVAVAFSADGVTFGAPATVAHDEVGEQRGNGETYGAVMVAGGATAVRVTTDRPLSRVSVLALDSTAAAESGWGFGSTASAAVEQPSVINHAAWGANEAYRYDANGDVLWAPEFHPVQKLIVHHTATGNADPDPAATVRSIYYYHAVTQGWGDIGYNFLIDEAGRVYEGRYSREYAAGESPTGEDLSNRGVTGGHALNFNAGTVGVALLGTLTSRDTTAAARDAMERILAWKAERHGLDPQATSLYTNPVNGTQATIPNISGHRDVSSTECPGDAFYATLPALRSAVAGRISGVQATVPGAAVLKAAKPATGRGVALSWTVPSSGGSPITSYRIYRRTGTGAEGLLTTVGGTVTSYRDTANRKGASYTYRVVAVNAVGAGPYSNAATAVAR